MSLADKLKILDMLDQGPRISCIAQKFQVNVSTIRSIRDKKDSIRASAKILEAHAKTAKISRKYEKLDSRYCS